MRVPGFGVVKQISHIWHPRQDYGRTYGQPDRKLRSPDRSRHPPQTGILHIFVVQRERGSGSFKGFACSAVLLSFILFLPLDSASMDLLPIN